MTMTSNRIKRAIIQSAAIKLINLNQQDGKQMLLFLEIITGDGGDGERKETKLQHHNNNKTNVFLMNGLTSTHEEKIRSG